MSRCFPFPPRGYDKKSRTEDLDLLKKEKHREKKHKKEKRDKEKNEDKEKRDKDRSDEKHREKKEKKEKCRDKKKDKEKSQDKDKNNHVILDEKKLFGQAEIYRGEKSDEKSKDRGKNKSTVLGEKLKVLGHSKLYNGVVLGKNSHLALENKSNKLPHEVGSKIAIAEGKRGGLLAEKYASMEIRKDVGMPRMGVSTATPIAISERSKERKVNDGKMDRHGPGVGARASLNVHVQKFAGMARNRLEEMTGPVDKNADRGIELKETIRGKEGYDIQVDKRKDEDRRKTVQKFMEKDKEKKKEEKLKEMGGEKIVEQSRTEDISKVHADQLRGKDGNKNNFLITQSARLEKLPNEGNKGAAVPENLRKRKEYGPHGVLYEDDVGPNKMARLKSSSLPMTENGRSLQPSQNSTVFSPDRQHPLSNLKLDDKDCRKNGTINSHQSASTAPQSTARVDQSSGEVKKLPHPDTKYLLQVLSVPKIEEWPEFDDQEWLFCSSHTRLKKPDSETSGFDDMTPQLWAKALRIESADVFALPYVIPH